MVSAVGLAANRLSDSLNTDDILLNSGAKPPLLDEESEQELLARDFAFESRRTAGDTPLSGIEAGQLRGAAARSAAQARKGARNAAPAGPTTFGGNWTSLGPSPISEVTRSTPIIAAMNGRIGALAIRKDGTWILGGAQGGIWVLGPTASAWVAKTDSLPSLAIGALAIAPTNDNDRLCGHG